MADSAQRDESLVAGIEGADHAIKIEQLLLSGRDHYVRGQLERAIDVWTRVLFLDRSHARARAYIDQARAAVAERVRESEALLHAGVAACDRGDVDPYQSQIWPGALVAAGRTVCRRHGGVVSGWLLGLARAGPASGSDRPGAGPAARAAGTTAGALRAATRAGAGKGAGGRRSARGGSGRASHGRSWRRVAWRRGRAARRDPARDVESVA